MYIRCNRNDNVTDVEYFDLSNVNIVRLKKYIMNNDPGLVVWQAYYESIEDFLTDYYSLQSIFADADDIVDYVKEQQSICTDRQECQYLEVIEDALTPYDLSELAFEMSSPYSVGSVEPFGEPKFSDIPVDNAADAIKLWFKMGKKYPSCVSIFAKDNSLAQELLEWVVDNYDKFSNMYNTYNTPYKFDYLYNFCINHKDDTNLLQWDGDQVPPFCAG